MMPVAIALSGGGARGAAQVGVLRAFDEFGIRPDMVLGASAGAVNGAWYALRPGRLDDLAGVWLGLSKRGVFPGTPAHYAYNLARHGHVHRIESWGGILRKSFDDALIEDAAIPLTLLTVRLADGKVMTHDAGPLVPALMASTAAPGVFPPQRLGGELHVDGAVVEFLPIPTAVRQGATTIYAVDCSDYPGGDGSRGMAMDRAGQIAATAWVRLVIEAARAQGVNVHHVRPDLGELYDGRDFRQTTTLMRLGYEHACRLLEARSGSSSALAEDYAAASEVVG